MSNFNYCSLIWMYLGKTSNDQVDRVQKRALRILHNDFNTQFEVLLEITDERKVHTKNLQKLMLQIFRCLSEENPSFMWTFLERKYIKYELRSKNLLQLPKRSANTFGVKGSTKTSMLCTKSTTCSPQLPEYLTVRNSQKQKQTVAKAAGLCTPFNSLVFKGALLWNTLPDNIKTQTQQRYLKE